MTIDPFAPVANPAPTDTKKANRRCIVPVPQNAPKAPTTHPKLGAPSKTWTYLDGCGQLLGYVFRFDLPNGEKSFRPLCLFEEPGMLCWRWQSWTDQRPLYGLDRLAKNPNAPIVMTEGEKATDAAQALLPGHVCITSPGGSNGTTKVDFSPLKGRTVIIWPDADEAGQKYADAARTCLEEVGAKAVSVVALPSDVPNGWDAADALEAGWTTEQAADFVRQGEEIQTHKRKQANSSAGKTPRPKPKKRGSILDAAKGAEFWYSPQKQVFATVPVNGHSEHWPLESKNFKRWFSARIHEQFVHVPSGQSIADALRILEVRAFEEGRCLQPFIRTGWDGEACWLDLADDAWRAVRITRHGWEVMENPPVKFLRTETMEQFPDPIKAELIEELRPFVNASDDDYKLIVAWLVACLFGRARNYPVLALGGEQGSGKSTMARLLRSLTDPCHVSNLSTPKDERDLIVMAISSHVLSFDNVSKVENWFSDAICRLATGAGFITRKLHSDGDPFWFQGSRPVLLNGIPSLTERADLAERSLTVRLLKIDETSRQSEDEFWKAWELAKPGILGALLDAVSAALRHWETVELKEKPRMADFAHMMTAAEPGLGWETGEFMAAYTANRQATTEAVFESDPVAVAIQKFIQDEHPTNGWEGTATELLGHLNRIVSEDIRRSRFWPAKPNALGNAIDRAAPLLRHRGIHMTKRSTGAQRLIILSVA
ncbi:DUF6371 domain-containing protein [Roseibium sediminis]|uniref:DUF6371 domain-containing protein n=1 Tax=Roseibium sediminis TaxID=1775174 RepID=UPI001AD8CB3F|nr:DUF6371 domain-containing protein [Roseibium sediminis]